MTRNTAKFQRIETGEWVSYPAGTAYRGVIHLIPEPDGGFSAIAVNLPGVASQGDTETEALEEVRQAMLAAIWTYRQFGEPIPWLSEEKWLPPPPGAMVKHITVECHHAD